MRYELEPFHIRVKMIEPGMRYALGYADGERLQADLRFDGVMPPQPLMAVGSTFGLAWDSQGSEGIVIIDAARLRQLLSPYAAMLRLVVLCACDSGNSGAFGNQLGSVAQTLHRAGIAAVVASRYPLSVAGGFAAGKRGEALREHMKHGYEAARPSGWDPGWR